MDRVQDELLSKIGGAAGREFFGGWRLGSVVGRAISQDSRAKSRAALMMQASRDALQVVDETYRILSGVRSLLPPRFYAPLAIRLSRARSAARPGTVLSHSTSVMDQFLGFEPPSRGLDAPPEDYAILRELETALRGHIRLRLSGLTPSWWTQRVPEDVRKAAEDRRLRRERMWPWSKGEEGDALGYLDFADYLKIISKRDNWRDAFQSTFKDEEILRAKLRELEAIRNDVAHMRPLTPAQRTKLTLHSDELLQAIRAS